MLYLPHAALLACVASAATTPVIKQNEHLKMDFSVLKGDSISNAAKGVHAKFVSLDNSTELQLTNAYVYYSATLKVGSNGDQNTVLVDTGSSDLWVMSKDVSCYLLPVSKRSVDDSGAMKRFRVFDIENNAVEKLEKRATATLSKIHASTCTSLGSFNTENSQSFQRNSSAPAFGTSYGDGNYANGIWGQDSVSVGGLNVSQCNLAVADEATSPFGVLGIGLAGLELTNAAPGLENSFVHDENSFVYENFPVQLKNNGYIEKLVYSLYLNEANAMTGSVLFGAVDHAKYSGQLQTVPIVNTRPERFEKPVTFDVVVNTMTLEGFTQNITVNTAPYAALLDSGSTLTSLPRAILDSITSLLDAKYSEKQGAYEVSCNYNTSSAHLVFNISGVRISVPLSDLIMNSEVLGEVSSKCFLGLVPIENSDPDGFPEAILGDNFLRHAYVVYNLEDYEISLAQVKYSEESNIEVVSSAIPSAVKAPGYSSTSLLSSIVPQPTGSHLSTDGLKSSEASHALHFAKSVVLAIVGVSLLLIL